MPLAMDGHGSLACARRAEGAMLLGAFASPKTRSKDVAKLRWKLFSVVDVTGNLLR